MTEFENATDVREFILVFENHSYGIVKQFQKMKQLFDNNSPHNLYFVNCSNIQQECTEKSKNSRYPQLFYSFKNELVDYRKVVTTYNYAADFQEESVLFFFKMFSKIPYIQYPSHAIMEDDIKAHNTSQYFVVEGQMNQDLEYFIEKMKVMAVFVYFPNYKTKRLYCCRDNLIVDYIGDYNSDDLYTFVFMNRMPLFQQINQTLFQSLGKGHDTITATFVVDRKDKQCLQQAKQFREFVKQQTVAQKEIFQHILFNWCEIGQCGDFQSGRLILQKMGETINLQVSDYIVLSEQLLKISIQFQKDRIESLKRQMMEGVENSFKSYDRQIEQSN